MFHNFCPIGIWRLFLLLKPAPHWRGEMFRAYLARGGKRGRVTPDFLIAAHAQCHASRLLARDRGYYRDYFSHLKLWDMASS